MPTSHVIPAQDQPSPVLLKSILDDWLEAHPEDTFRSPDPSIEFLLSEMFPAQVRFEATDNDQSWAGFWDGWLPGDQVEDPVIDSDLIIGRVTEDGQVVLDEESLDALCQAILVRLNTAFSGSETSSLPWSIPHA